MEICIRYGTPTPGNKKGYSAMTGIQLHIHTTQGKKKKNPKKT